MTERIQTRYCGCDTDFQPCGELVAGSRESEVTSILIDRFGRWTTATIRRHLKDQSLFTDVFHDVLIMGTVRLPRWSESGLGLCWWIAKVTSRTISRYNYQTRKRGEESSITPQDSACPESNLDDFITSEAVHHCLASISTRFGRQHADVIRWRIDGIQTGEIARRLDVDRRTINRWLTKAGPVFAECMGLQVTN